MNPAEEVERPLGNPVSDTTDGISEVLSSCDESHAHQQEGHADPVVKAEHEIIDPGRVMFGDDCLQWLYDAIHVGVVTKVVLSALLPASSSQAKPMCADAGGGLLAAPALYSPAAQPCEMILPSIRPVLSSDCSSM